jgi:hypothetical protein
LICWALDEEARARAAALAVVEEDRVGGAFDREIDVGVAEHDVRRLPAELERDLLQVAGRRLDDEAPDLGRAGERDLVDVGMRGDRGARRLAVAGHDVQHAVRVAGLAHELGEPQRGERRLLGGLQHDGAAGRERGPELPRRHEEREVPRDDLADDADRLAHGPRHVARHRDRERRALDLRRPARHVAEDVDRERHVGGARHDLRLAVVEALELRELVGVRLEEVGELPEQAAAVRRRHRRPRAGIERAARGAHGALHVLAIAFRDLRDHLARRRVVARERLAGSGLDPLAVDQHRAAAGDETLDLGL